MKNSARTTAWLLIAVFFFSVCVSPLTALIMRVQASEFDSAETEHGEGKEDCSTEPEETSESVEAWVASWRSEETDGYRITVAWAAEAMLSEHVRLDVCRLMPAAEEYDKIISESVTAAGMDNGEIASALAFDISLVDTDTNEKLSPAVPVQVQVEALTNNLTGDGAVAVIHVEKNEDDGNPKYNIIDASATPDTIEFETDSFSVFVIIEGPPLANTDLETAASLFELPGDGYWLSITKGSKTYYFKDEINNKRCIARTGDGDYEDAAVWYFEPTGTENEYWLYVNTQQGKRYMVANSDTYMNLSETEKTAFTVSLFNQSVPGYFYIKVSGTASTGLNYSGSNDSFKCYTQKNNDCKIVLTYPKHETSDTYGLDGKSYILANYDRTSIYAYLLSITPAADVGTLAAVTAAVRQNPLEADETLLTAEDNGAALWTFHSVGGDFYAISVETDGGTRYLTVDGTTLSLVAREEAGEFRFVPGDGAKAGQFKLTANGAALSYDKNKKAFIASTAGSDRDWLSFASPSGLTNTDFVNYSAEKISASDTDRLYNGSKVILYTRVWNDSEKRYYFYLVDHDGRLVRCYEHGDQIQWVGTQINTAVWDFTEYYYEGTNIPNNYYELKNEYSGIFIAPQISGDVLSEQVIGLSLPGRPDGSYYTQILAWDDPYYTYAAMKTSGLQVCTGYMPEAEDFYFALLSENEALDPLRTVETLDNEQYGIKMKLVNFGNTAEDIVTVTGQYFDPKGKPYNSTISTSREQYEVIGPSVYDAYRPTQGLLSTGLAGDGYPVAEVTGRSLAELFGNGEPVNHLFDRSIYLGSGYYEFDSTQNFATLTESGDFKVYNGLGTVDGSNKSSLKHGQFLPYNDITADYMASVNPENLYNAVLNELPNDDPRKHERLHLVRKPDYFFGMEIEASFVQTPNGHDKWGHDIIYEFTGDDDFWLYVDGELVIDLGGIHSAYPGSVNFCTGEVNVNGTNTTLKQVFRENYANRHGLSEADPAVESYLDGIFKQNQSGQYVFKDYSTHQMKIFFMERGASASNLHMRFNLASVKEGQVLLGKTLSGPITEDYFMSQYAFQVYYSLPGAEGAAPEYNLLPPEMNGEPTVTMIDSSAPVQFAETYNPPGSETSYDSVFFLYAGKTASINLPDETIQYYIVECGLNTEVYDEVHVNGELLAGSATDSEKYRDYSVQPAAVSDRSQVIFDNHINENAVRTLTVTKRIYEADGVTALNDPDASFNFRLYLAPDNGTDFVPANMKAYAVKSQDGRYCKWSVEDQRFEPIQYSAWTEIPEAQKNDVLFHTSPNGAISKIPADYHVEVRGLLVGTRFRVEERENEIPEGYVFLRYERDANSYIVESGDTVNSGTIRAGQSPAIEIHNKLVWELTGKKVWSDAAYMDSHADIFMAVYADGELLPETIRILRHPETSVTYKLEQLIPGKEFSDYEVYEVDLTGEYVIDENGHPTGEYTVTKYLDGDTVSIMAAEHNAGEQSYEYDVHYERVVPSGVRGNIKTDEITNSRKGIRIIKQDAIGNPLQGAVFTLTDSSQNPVGESRYISDVNGLVTIAYLRTNEIYTLTEITAPKGYFAMPEPLVFSVSNGQAEVNSGDADFYEISNNDGPVIAIKNKQVSFCVKKTDADTGTPLEGVEFSLYPEVTVGGVTRMDYRPLAGYESLITGPDGKLPDINEFLPPGSYYLVETSALDGYAALAEPVRFSVRETGEITVDEINAAERIVASESACVEYVLKIKNKKEEIIIVPYSMPDLPHTGGDGFRTHTLMPIFFLIAAGFLLLKKKKTN